MCYTRLFTTATPDFMDSLPPPSVIEQLLRDADARWTLSLSTRREAVLRQAAEYDIPSLLILRSAYRELFDRSLTLGLHGCFIPEVGEDIEFVALDALADAASACLSSPEHIPFEVFLPVHVAGRIQEFWTELSR